MQTLESELMQSNNIFTKHKKTRLTGENIDTLEYRDIFFYAAVSILKNI